jgi:hypothetical protein
VGAWGVGLFANDLSRDVKDAFKELVRLPFSEAELIEAMLDAFPAGRDANDEEYTDFWLALADLFHGYAIVSSEVSDRARAIVESGADLKMKRALEMSEADLRKREKLLNELLDKWRSPAAKPRQRRIMQRPEPFLFEAGDCVVFPTHDGNAAPAFMTAAAIAAQFAPDGWGAFVVLATARRYGYWACYLVGRLHLSTPDKPTLDDCRTARFSGLRVGVPGLPRDVAVKTVTITKAEANKMKLEPIGRLDLDQAALGAKFADRYALVADPYWSIAGLLRPYGDGRSLMSERPVEMKQLALSRFLR